MRATFFGIMLLCNAMVWTFFVKALHSSGGSLVATVCSAATNYFVSVSPSQQLEHISNVILYLF